MTDDHTLATRVPADGRCCQAGAALFQSADSGHVSQQYLLWQWGIAQASQTFFGKAPQALDWTEARLLAGLPQASSSYDSTRHWELARSRQRHVLDRLVETGGLSQTQADAAYLELTRLGR